MGEPPQGYVGCGTRESLGAGQFDGSHPQPFDVPRVSDGAHRDPVVNLEKFLPRFAEREKQDPVPIPQGYNWTAAGQLRLDVLRPIRNRFDPAVRLFDHATLRLNTAPIFF